MTNKRKTNIIKRRFQNELILKTVLTTFITFNLILLGAYLMADSVFSSKLSAQQFMQYIAVMEAFAAVFIYMVSRKFSFHIAGPVYAVERSLKAMNEGDLTIFLQLRDRDNFEEVSEILNVTLDTYCQQVNEIKQLLAKVKADASSSSEQASLLDELEQKLSFFKTEKTTAEEEA